MAIFLALDLEMMWLLGENSSFILIHQSKLAKTYLSQYVVHGLAGLHVILTKHSQQSYEPDLEERVTDTGHVMVRAVSGQDEVLQYPHQIWHKLKRETECRLTVSILERVFSNFQGYWTNSVQKLYKPH